MKRFLLLFLLTPFFTNTQAQCCFTVGADTQLVNYTPTWGAWMQDPEETDGAGIVYAFPHYSNYTTFVEYPTMNDFSTKSNGITHNLTLGFDGTGHVVYDGFLYYNQSSTSNMVKYDISADTIVTTALLPNAGNHNTYHYQWGGYSDIDFAVDENGLWVIYSTAANAGKLVVSKLDTSDLSVVKTWNTNSEEKKQMGNAFMVCGVLYCIDAYNITNTTINYTFNTWDSTGTVTNIPFTNSNSYMTEMDYNYNTQTLHSWSSGNCYSYDINSFGPDLTTSSVDNNCNGDSLGSGIPTVTGGASPYSFQWDANTGNQTDSVATGLTAGTYYVTVTDNNGCSTIDSAVVTEPSAIALSSTPTDESFLGNDGAIDLTSSGGTPPYTYNWNNGDTTEDIDSLEGGTYTVTVTDSLGCTDTLTVVLGSAVNTTYYSVTGNSVKLFPNPASSQVTVQIAGINGHTEVTISDALSRTIIHELVNQVSGSYTKTYNVDNLPKGIYFLSVKSKNRGLVNKKLVIE